MSQLDESVPWWRLVYADGTPASCHSRRAPELLSDEGTPMAGAPRGHEACPATMSASSGARLCRW